MKRAVLLVTAAALAASPAFAGVLQPANLTAQPWDFLRVALSMGAHEYVTQTAQINTAEIDAGKLAQSKSSNPDVKQFAAMMIKDHGDAEAKLIKIVGAQKGATMPTPGVSPKDAALKQKLEAASGAAFDKMYIEAMVEGHTAALKIQQAYAKSGDNAALKAFATDMTKAVEMHLEHAKAIAAKLTS